MEEEGGGGPVLKNLLVKHETMVPKMIDSNENSVSLYVGIDSYRKFVSLQYHYKCLFNLMVWVVRDSYFR